MAKLDWEVILRVMEAALEHRLEDLEKEVAKLKKRVATGRTAIRSWRQAAGMLDDTTWAREADKLGQKWRRAQTKP